MRIHTLTLALAAGLALTACADVKTTSGPPIAGSSTGPGAAPLQQQARDTMGGNSANASGGAATISGTRSAGDSGGKPTVDYTGTAPAAGVGSSTPQTPVARNRSNKGG